MGICQVFNTAARCGCCQISEMRSTEFFNLVQHCYDIGNLRWFTVFLCKWYCKSEV